MQWGGVFVSGPGPTSPGRKTNRRSGARRGVNRQYPLLRGSIDLHQFGGHYDAAFSADRMSKEGPLLPCLFLLPSRTRGRQARRLVLVDGQVVNELAFRTNHRRRTHLCSPAPTVSRCVSAPPLRWGGAQADHQSSAHSRLKCYRIPMPWREDAPLGSSLLVVAAANEPICVRPLSDEGTWGGGRTMISTQNRAMPRLVGTLQKAWETTCVCCQIPSSLPLLREPLFPC